MNASLKELTRHSAPALYTYRPMRREDVPAVYDMLLAADRADGRPAQGTLGDAIREFDDPWIDPETDSLLAFARDGSVAGMARIFVNPKPKGECPAFLWGEVHPEHRGRGLGEFLLSWMEARATERVQAAPAGMKRLLRASFPEDLADRIALFERHGFAPARYFFRMRRDLGQPIPDQPLPEGLVLRTFAPELSAATLDAFNASFRDHWGFQPASEEDWRVFFVERSSFRPDLTLLAMDGDRVAAFSINRVSPEENERNSILEGWIGQLGTRREWRKRGVASALLCESMRRFRTEGLDFATLGVDTENLTGALSLYEGLGFVADKRTVTFDRPVEQDAPA